MKKFSVWWKSFKEKCQTKSQNFVKKCKEKNPFKRKKKKEAFVKENEVESVMEVESKPVEQEVEKEELPVLKMPKIKEKRKRRFHFPSLIILNSKRTKRAALIALPTCIALTGIGLGIYFGNKKPTIEKEVVLETEKVYHHIYLLSDDDYVVPLSLKMERKNTMQEEMLDVFNYLKVDTSLKTDHLRGYIPTNTTIKKLTIDNQILTFDLSKDFLEYEEKNETNLVESFVHTFLDFEGIQGLKLQVEGVQISKLPNGLMIGETLTKEVGINRPYISSLDVLNKKSSIVYYEKTWSQKEKYYVPVTVFTDKKDSSLACFYDAIQVRPNIITGLKKIATYQQIDTNVAPLENEQGIVLGIKEVALMEEGLVNQDIYELILLSFSFMGIDKNVSLQVNGETVQVNGYVQEETVEVSNISYNEVAI